MINQKIKKLRTNGFSLKEISKKLNKPYSTVRRYCKKIKMSRKGKDRYHTKVNGVVRKYKIKSGLSKEKVRIISNLLFDGSVYVNNYKYSIMYVNSSLEMVEQFKEEMKKVYNTSRFSFEKTKGKNVFIYRVKYISKQICEDLLKYIKTYSTSNKKCSIPDNIINRKPYNIILLRAFWENEGSISKDGKLSADLKNLRIINQLSELHNEFGIKNYVSKYWDISYTYKLILNKSEGNYKKFMDLKLFSKSIVTKGYFIGMKKVDVLKKYIKNKY